MGRRTLTPKRILRYLARVTVGTIYRFRVHDRVLALTFDDGPHPIDTPAVLELLERYGAKATFFMVGESVRKYPEIVAQVVRAGHTIGNHSFHHMSMPEASWKQRSEEWRLCQQALGGFATRYFRMPYGHQSPMSHLQALLRGYRVIGWTHKAEDTSGWSSDKMISHLQDRLSPGDIILAHDTVCPYPGPQLACRCEMLAFLESILDHYTKLGFTWVNMETMTRIGKPERTLWYRYATKEVLCGSG